MEKRVVLLDHQPEWAQQAAAVVAELQALPGLAAWPIEHIGSTAVPGLCAKPVLDLLLGLPDLDAAANQLIAALPPAGWQYRPEHEATLPERRYFTRAATPDCPRLHLHAVQQGGSFWQRHLAFRNALRQRPEWAAQYGALKQQLAQVHARDAAAYTEAKGPFIRACLAELGV